MTHTLHPLPNGRCVIAGHHAFYGGDPSERYDYGLFFWLILGGALIAAGHFLLAFHGMTTFYAGLALIVAGTGFFKPNSSTIVGQMYRPGDPRRDGGFTIFYFGVNVGAPIAIAGFEQLVIDAGDGNDVFDVQSTAIATTLGGGDGNDIFAISGTGAGTLAVDGQNGSDSYTVNFGNLLGLVSISDSGTSLPPAASAQPTVVSKVSLSQ